MAKIHRIVSYCTLLIKECHEFINLKTLDNVPIYELKSKNKMLQEYKNKLDKIACVDVDKIFMKLNLRNQGLKSFLKQLQSHLIAKEIDKIDELIVLREKHLKTAERAKLLHPEKFNKEDFQDYFVGTAFLDYRMNSARRILKDIYEAEHV